MGNSISESIHFFPIKLRVLFFERLRKIFAGHANNLKIPNNGIYCFVIQNKILKAEIVYVFLHPLHGQGNVLQVQDRIAVARFKMQ
jgi:hypothetical protein